MMAVERPTGVGNSPSPVATAATAIQLTLSSLVPRQLQSQSKSLSSSSVTSIASSASSSPHSTPRLTLNRSLSNFTTLSSSISNFNSLSNLSASSSAILKERLSQLKQSAQSKHEAAAKAMKSHIEYVRHLSENEWPGLCHRSPCIACSQSARHCQVFWKNDSDSVSTLVSCRPQYHAQDAYKHLLFRFGSSSFQAPMLSSSSSCTSHSSDHRNRCLLRFGPSFSFNSSFPFLWPILAVYMIFVYFDKAPEHGGRSNQWFRSCLFWRYFADYYPASYVRLSLSIDDSCLSSAGLE